jgi:hypothetical protein
MVVPYNSHSSPRIIRKMILAGHVVRKGRGGMNIGYWWESCREREPSENQDVGGWIILKWILER